MDIKKLLNKLIAINYDRHKIVLTIALISFLKIVFFSIGIKAPETDWDWRLLTIVIFIVSNLSIIFVLLTPTLLFKTRKKQIIYSILINFSLSFIIIANRLYNQFFHSYISLDTVSHSTEGLSMFQALYSTIRLGEIFWLLDIPILIYIFSKQHYNEINEKSKVSPPMKAVIVISVTILLWTPIMSIYTGNLEHHQNIQLKESGLFMYYAKEAATSAPLVEERQKEDIRNVQQIEQWFANKAISEGRLTAEMENKNLIVLQVEALQEIVINKEINGQEITPNLNEIFNESIYFENVYDQVEMATADAEVLVNLSQYPLDNVSVYMRYPDNKFHSWPHALKKEGYETAALHGHYGDFYNRDEAYPNIGFEKFFSREHYKEDEMHNDLLGDKTFLEQSVPYLEELENPFNAFIITLTSHHPFNYLESYDEINVDPYKDTIVGDYIESIHYTDAAIGKFYDEMEEKGLLEDTLIAIYGDHAAFNYNERDYEELNDFFSVNIHDPVERVGIHKVPFMIHDPSGGLNSKVIDEQAGMIDIMPTVGNLLGIENPYAMGRDILNTGEDEVILKEGSFIKDDIYYYSKTRTFYDLETGKEVEVENDEELIAQAEDTLDVSNLIYKTDYFRDILDN
ncbi:LTA synthase family protein [Natranaerobius trueperi]|uniref:Sulfatase N-terminal domain-containing protein n=1 Tax=Natranaerobius trueperi TaxID=759412 RepID=A0A226BVI2_9FIRM|nr:LTA synthase family protein [Natranaerobius trueperi]OWZ82985.1 hypothetical protein CDO51_11160 [Natranaerobius trueperi]